MTDSERYRPLQLLATGGMSELWLAHDRATGTRGRFVALKRMTPSARNDVKLKELFVAESRLLAQLQHPNIVQVLDSFEGDEQHEPWLALEFLLGADVRTLLSRATAQDRTLPIEAACAIVAGAARGLHFAHQKRDPTGDSLRVVHRDVSPHNIFVTRDGAVKVLDFGIARSAEQLHQTSRTELKGKLGYMAPEQLEGRPLDARADIYGLGVVLWELVTGRRLWHRDHPLMANWATLHELPPPPSELRPEVSPALESLVLQMLARDPSDRPPDAEQVAITLEQQLFAIGCASPTDAIRDVIVELAPPTEPSLDAGTIATFNATPQSIRPSAPSTGASVGSAQPESLLVSAPPPAVPLDRREGTSVRTRRTMVALALSSLLLSAVSVVAIVTRTRTTDGATNTAQGANQRVQLRVVGAPEGSVLRVDGVALGADGTLVASPARRRLELVHNGATLLEIERVVDRDVELYVTPPSSPTANAGRATTDGGVTARATPTASPSGRAPRVRRATPSSGNGTSTLPYVLQYNDED
ncbi:MAG: serine/threonine protein kinase [Myxococcales bacterium]|nr:serine/threonine protein kinase [Myxococcales bacterium]